MVSPDVLVALSDTHADADPRLTPHLADVLMQATAVAHAGDFTSESVLAAFERRVADADGRFTAVHGNADSRAVSERLPATDTLVWANRRLVVVHGHRHDSTSLSLLARQERADVVVTGHTHRQAIEQVDDITVVNPGSHADPRGGQPGYAAFEGAGRGGRCVLRSVEGDRIRAVEL